MKKVFEISPDFDNFRFLLSVPDIVENELLETKKRNGIISVGIIGQSLAPNFPRFKFKLFCDPRKKKDKRRIDFNVSCWNAVEFICDYETKLKFEKKFGNKVEIFPVDTDLESDFYYINLLVKVKAIDNSVEKKWDEQQDFIQENIKNEIFFRDDYYDEFYYVTEDFIEWVKENEIKGMRFELAGYMR